MVSRKPARERDAPAEKPVSAPAAPAPEGGSVALLLVLVGGIYASFLSWALLQERIATAEYGGRHFGASHAIAALQSLFASFGGFLMLRRTCGAPVWPRFEILKSYAFIAACQALSNPLAYSALAYVDYLTVLLAKSCKLLPVMAVHVVLYRTKFPAYKYVVVALVTLGVALFSAGKGGNGGSTSARGLAMLGAALLLDGLYNTTQDALFKKHRGEISGPQMMAVLNLFTCVLSSAALVLSGQLVDVFWFVRNAPAVLFDVLLYAVCGAVGQIFVFLTLERFGSLVLVTTTVTRKMGSMLLSVLLFNHKLARTQWLGVACVFAGVAYEALRKLR